MPTDRFLIGVDESIVGDLLRSQLPLERPLGKRFVVQLDSATVSLRDKFGVITIEGNVHRRETPDARPPSAFSAASARSRSTPPATCSL